MQHTRQAPACQSRPGVDGVHPLTLPYSSSLVDARRRVASLVTWFLARLR